MLPQLEVQQVVKNVRVRVCMSARAQCKHCFAKESGYVKLSVHFVTTVKVRY